MLNSLAQCEMFVTVVCFLSGIYGPGYMGNMIAGKSRQISVISNGG